MEVTKYQGYLQTHMKNQELIGMLPATAAELVALENGKSVEEAYKEQSKQINVLSNPNLLINGDFQVWQRGESFIDTSTGGYCADRWRIQGGATGVNIKRTDKGLTLFSDNSTYWGIAQTIENYKQLNGKTVTLSAKINVKKIQNGSISLNYHVNDKWADLVQSHATEIGEFILSETFTFPAIQTSMPKVDIQFNSSIGEFEVEYIKLEIGDKATPHVPRSYAEELAMCERYYQKVRVQERIYNYNANELYAITNLRTIMRVIPTLSKISEPTVSYINGGKIDGYVFDTTSWSGAIKSITLRATKNSHGLTEAVLKAELELDAEIY